MGKVIKNNIFLLKFVWDADKAIFFVSILLCLCSFMSPLQDTYLPKIFVDILSTDRQLQKLSICLMIWVGMAVYKSIIYPLYRNYFHPLAKEKTSKLLNLEMMEKAFELDLMCYEQPEFYDKYTRALAEVDERAMDIFDTMVSLVNCIIYMLVLISVILILDPVLLAVGVITSVLSLICTKMLAQQQFEYKNKSVVFKRRNDYFKRILYQPEYAKETHFFQLKKFLITKYEATANEGIHLYKKYGKRICMLDMVPDLFSTILLQVVVVIYLVIKISRGELTPGDFIALYLATAQFSAQLDGIGMQFSEIYKNSLYVDNLNSILEYKPKIEKRIGKEPEKFESLRFEHVSFKYDGSSRCVLKDLNMEIKKGEKIAIVGLNGAGKSTLIKLLLNLYTTSEGGIYYNNTNIEDIDNEKYRERFGVIFQDGQTYAFSVAENILFKAEKEEDKEKIYTALEKANILEKISSLPQKEETLLTKEFDEGIMMSGGELQAIKLARLFVKDYDMYILDEPFNSLDVMMEYNLYSQFLQNSEKTIVLISHKLFTVQNVDRIYYIENGYIVEQGSHEDLIKFNGKYAALYRMEQELSMAENENFIV
ncbi:MAG: ABC transporter ATP-binding protein [Bariatricus sp.]